MLYKKKWEIKYQGGLKDTPDFFQRKKKKGERKKKTEERDQNRLFIFLG